MQKKFSFISMMFAIAASISILGLTGCEKDDDDDKKEPAYVPPANVAGTWKGPLTLSGHGASAGGTTTLKLVQDGENVSGNFVNGAAVSGTIKGNSLRLTGSKNGASMVVNGNVTDNTMIVTGTASSSGYTFNLNGTFTRVSTKQAYADEGDSIEDMLKALILSIEGK